MCLEKHKAGSLAQNLRETQASSALFWSQWPEVILKASSMSQGHSRVLSAPFTVSAYPGIQGRDSCQACPPRSAQLHGSLGSVDLRSLRGVTQVELRLARVRKEVEAVLSASLGTRHETMGERN